MEDLPCIGKCRSVQHGNLITAVARRGTDHEIVSLWAKSCQNYAHVKDCFGRTALHMIASTPHVKVVKWLLQHEGCNVQMKEPLSGYTPLHRSIFYGQLSVARALIQNGASISATDNEGLTPLDLYLVDRNRSIPSIKNFRISADPTEVYIWGTNDNYNLGTGSSSARVIPEPLEVFGNAKISQLVLQTYHSVFLSQEGVVFTCGVGLGGRLGLGNEQPALKPTPVKLNSNYRCTYVAADQDHTLLLMENGEVLSCGSNEYYTLGHNTNLTKIFAPKRIDSISVLKIEGVRTSRYHSVFYFKNRLYTCGTNFGHLGIEVPVGRTVVTPKLVNFSNWLINKEMSNFTLVECNEYSTVVYANKELYVLYQTAVKRIKISELEISQMTVLGGHPNNLGLDPGFSNRVSDIGDTACLLTILLLTKSGTICVWRENVNVSDWSKPSHHRYLDGTISRVYSSIGRSITVAHMSVNKGFIMVATTDGETFQGQWNFEGNPTICTNSVDEEKERPKTNYEWIIRKNRRKDNDALASSLLEYIKLRRVPNIYSAVNVMCDPKGKTFAVIQSHHRFEYITIPTVTPSAMNFDLEQLYRETSLEDDLHNVVFEVENAIGRKLKFPAHKFIIASGCTLLYNEIKNFELNNEDESISPVVVPILGTDEFIFQQVLEYIYTNKCAVIIPGTLLGENSNRDIGNTEKILRDLKAYARKLQLVTLCQKLKDIDIIDGTVCLKNPANLNSHNVSKAKTFDPNSFQSLADITLATADKKEVKAHRCILFARMEHFRTLWIGNFWNDSKSNRLPIPVSYLGARFLIDYLYADKNPDPYKYSTLPETTRNRGAVIDEKLSCVDMAVEALSTSDYFFVEGLRTRTELVLYEMISHRNIAKILTLATYFNAEQLKEACHHFISLNVSALLENKLLDDLSTEIMEEVTEYYQSFHPHMSYRRLRPDSVLTPNDESYQQISASLIPEFESFVNNFDDYMATRSPGVSSKTPKRRRNKSKNYPESENMKDSSLNLSSSFEESDNYMQSSRINQPKTILPSETAIPIRDSSTNMPINSSRPMSAPIQIPIGAKLTETNLQRQACPPTTSSHRKSVRPCNLERTRTFSTEEFPLLEDVPPEGLLHRDLDHVKSDLNSRRFVSAKSEPKNHSTSLKVHGKKKVKWVALGSDELAKKTATVNTSKCPVSGRLDRDPKNPWNRMRKESVGDKEDEKVCETKSIRFNEIVQDEREKEENWKKITSKPFRLMQIEDKAIEQLLKHYTSQDTIDGIEIVTVERVTAKNVGNPPSWPTVSPSTAYTCKIYK